MKAWSFSALDSYETCPFKHFNTRVNKVFKEPEGEQMKWGLDVHKGLENYTVHGKPLPAGMEQFKTKADIIMAAPGTLYGEREIALTSSFQPCGWWDKQTWVRIKIDVLKVNGVVAFVGDYKTGKFKPGSDQLMLNAAGVLTAEPNVQTTNTAYIWLQGNHKPTVETYKREDLGKLWSHFLPRVERYQLAHEQNKWEKKPSGLCKKHCPVSSCEFHGER